MQRYIHTNLDFEYQLRFGDTWTRPKPMVETLKRWQHILRLVPGWEDAQPTEAWGGSNTLYWGISRPGAGADVDTVRRVNSKVFSHRFAQEAGVELPSVRLCSSMAELEDALTPEAMILKHPLGFSGRERIEVCGQLDVRQRGWVSKVLTEGPILAEPKVSVAREWSLQFEIGEHVELLGTASLLVDRHGQHRGHVVGWDSPNTDIQAIATHAAWAVQRAGYRGPLGVDAFEGEWSGQPIVRPVSELNARMTFGRMAIELARHASGAMAWWLPSDKVFAALEEASEVGAFDGTSALRRLPDWCDPGGVSKSLVITDRAEILRHLGERHNL